MKGKQVEFGYFSFGRREKKSAHSILHSSAHQFDEVNCAWVQNPAQPTRLGHCVQSAPGQRHRTTAYRKPDSYARPPPPSSSLLPPAQISSSFFERAAAASPPRDTRTDMAAFTKLEDSPMFRKQVPAPALPVSAHEGSLIRLPRMHCFVFLRISAVSMSLHGFGLIRICGMEGSSRCRGLGGCGRDGAYLDHFV